MNEELKPCPFCGGKPEIEEIGFPYNEVVVACHECSVLMENGFENRKQLIDAWNKRFNAHEEKI